MKVLSVIGFIISLLGVGAGIYNQVEFVPKCEMDLFSGDLFHYYHEQKFFWGSIALFASIPGAILGLITGLKKQKIGWVAMLLGLLSFVLGAMQATHMFS